MDIFTVIYDYLSSYPLLPLPALIIKYYRLQISGSCGFRESSLNFLPLMAPPSGQTDLPHNVIK